VVEGIELVRLALEVGQPIEGIYVDAAQQGGVCAPLLAQAEARGIRVYLLEPGLLEKVADTVTPQPVLAVVPMATVALDALEPGLVLVLAELRDPGNVGTLLRSAEAAGASGVVLLGHAVDPFNPKAVRSSAGAVLQVPLVVEPDAEVALQALSARGFRIYGTAMTGGVAYGDADWTGPVALVLGNEAHGLDPRLVPRLDGLVTIEMAGRAESLNVAMAGTVLCFEALRQRRQASGGAAAPTYDVGGGDG